MVVQLSLLCQGATVTLTYTGDRLTTRKEGTGAAVPFAHDAFARMTTDAESGLSIAYNALDLPESISQGTTLKARYTYLSDGTKVSAQDATGAGLVYRGPFTYRRNPSGTLTFESAAFEGGRLTEAGPRYFVTDHLGSVRAVIDGNAAQQLPIRRRGSTRSTTTLRTGPSFLQAHRPASAWPRQAKLSPCATPSPGRRTRGRTSGCRTSTTAQGSTARPFPAGSSPTRWERSTAT